MRFLSAKLGVTNHCCLQFPTSSYSKVCFMLAASDSSNCSRESFQIRTFNFQYSSRSVVYTRSENNKIIPVSSWRLDRCIPHYAGDVLGISSHEMSFVQKVC